MNFRIMILILGLVSSAQALGALSGDLTIHNVRTYTNGLVVQVAESVNPSCTYPDHLQLHMDNVANYKASVSLFMIAWAQGKTIRVYHDGCGPTQSASGGGNVYVNGWFVN